MPGFIKELIEGEIHFRDRLQFELKSEFFPDPSKGAKRYNQELFLFIPSALHITKETYSKHNFYHDQTTLIRYKTPEMSLVELLEIDRSPLQKLMLLSKQEVSEELSEQVVHELKLYSNILRSSLRCASRDIIHSLETISHDKLTETVCPKVEQLVADLARLRDRYAELREVFTQRWGKHHELQHFKYVELFINNSTDLFLTGLLERLRGLPKDLQGPKMTHLDHALCDTIKQVNEYGEGTARKPEAGLQLEHYNETFQYRRGLLKKYVLDVLRLNTDRQAVATKYAQIVAGVAAGLAMLFYLLLFIWQGSIFVINSTPFVVLTTILYIAKDRIKDWIKSLFAVGAARWFPDFSTEIIAPDHDQRIGVMHEYFSFTSPDDLPEEISNMRNREFHYVLEEFRRPETVIYSKKTLVLDPPQHYSGPDRRSDLNTIFRLNIHRFLEKASDSTTPFLSLDLRTERLVKYRLPKVYHLNIIVRNSYTDDTGEKYQEIKKYRAIINKNGLKRVEAVL